MSALFCFGLGFSAKTLGARLLEEGWRVMGTARNAAACEAAGTRGFECVVFDGQRRSAEVSEFVAEATHILVSIPPGEAGDPALELHGDEIAQASVLAWIGYLSTVGVYGDRQGEWVDETSEPAPIGPRSQCRLAAERAWLAFGDAHALAVQIFRLPGIYGPGRNAIAGLRSGTGAAHRQGGPGLQPGARRRYRASARPFHGPAPGGRDLQCL